MIKPLGDKLAVKLIKAASESAGGIALIRDTDPDAPAQGEVMAIGPGGWSETGVREPLEVEVGNIVAFPKTAGIIMKDEGLIVMHEAEIIAVIR